MKVLLTGAAGFILQHLANDGHEVVTVDALIPHAHCMDASGASDRSADAVHRLDVRDADALLPLLDGVEVVCHQAAMVGSGVAVSDMPLYTSHNDLGTAVLMAAMAERGVDRLVLASSMVVYGEGQYECPKHGLVEPFPRTIADLEAGRFVPACPRCSESLTWRLVEEDAPLRPQGSYASSKMAQEHYARAWATQAPGAVIALRYHNVYGSHVPKDTPYAGVAAIFRSALARGDAPRVFEDGKQTRDFVHVDDVVRANLTAIHALEGRAMGSFAAYNVCSGIPISINEVANILTTHSPAAVEPVTTVRVPRLRRTAHRRVTGVGGHRTRLPGFGDTRGGDRCIRLCPLAGLTHGRRLMCRVTSR